MSASRAWAPGTVSTSPTGEVTRTSSSPTTPSRPSTPHWSRRPSAASTCEGCSGGPTGTVSASAPTGIATWARRSARPAGSACGTCGCARAALTTRSSWSSGTPRTRRATSPTSAASTCVTAGATTTTHDGDPQPVELAKAYGPTPPWHDVQVAIQGPAVHDVETTFRERWEDSTPLTAQPGAPGLELAAPRGPRPTSRWPPRHRLPLRDPTGTTSSRSVRTFPVISPKGFDFAPEGERSVMLSNTKAIAQADRLVYVEDQYLWSRGRGRALRHCAAGEPRPPAGGGAADGARPRRHAGRGAAAVRAVPGDAHDHRGGRRPGRGVRPVQRGRATDLRALQDLRHRPPLGQRGLRQPQPALVDRRQRDRLHRRRRARRPRRARAPRTPSRGCCCAPWSPSTWAASPTTCPRTRTSCSTRWWRAPMPSTSGTPAACPDKKSGIRGRADRPGATPHRSGPPLGGERTSPVT